MTQYFVWVTPDGAAFDQLSELMSRLGQQYQGPRFEPHITLLGGIEGEESGVVKQFRTLADRITPLLIHLQEPATENNFFRCVYFYVKETPELQAAYQQAQKFLGKMPASLFHPHLSVLYGEMPIGVWQEILEALPTQLPDAFLASTLTLIRAESLSPENWYLVERVQLQGQRH